MGAKTSRGLQIKQHFRKNMVPDFGYNCKKRHFFHFFCPGAKLSDAKLSWCQIVLVPNCPGPNCPTIKIRYHIFPEMLLYLKSPTCFSPPPSRGGGLMTIHTMDYLPPERQVSMTPC